MDLTPHNQRVWALLKETAKPLTAYEILDRLRRFGLRAPTTIYRALRDLEAKGLVHKIESLNAFTACCAKTPKGPHTSQIALCTRCGRIEELDDPKTARLLSKATSGFLAEVEKSVFEIAGICHACASSQGKKKSSCSR